MNDQRMRRQGTIGVANMVALDPSASAGGTAPPVAADTFGFALLCSMLTKDELTLVGMLVNRGANTVEVTWRNTHTYIVSITNKSGVVYSLNDHSDPPKPSQPATRVPSRGQHVREFVLRVIDWPGLSFDPKESPYRINVALNSESHKFAASVTLEVVTPSVLPGSLSQPAVP